MLVIIRQSSPRPLRERVIIHAIISSSFVDFKGESRPHVQEGGEGVGGWHCGVRLASLFRALHMVRCFEERRGGGH